MNEIQRLARLFARKLATLVVMIQSPLPPGRHWTALSGSTTGWGRIVLILVIVLSDLLRMRCSEGISRENENEYEKENEEECPLAGARGYGAQGRAGRRGFCWQSVS